MRRLGGVVRQVPAWGLGLILSLLVLIGVAPGVLFISELLMLKAAVDLHAYWTAALFLAALAVVFIGVLRRAIAIGWDATVPPPATPPTPVDRASWVLVTAPLAVLLVLGLCVPAGLQGILRQAAAIITGGPP